MEKRRCTVARARSREVNSMLNGNPAPTTTVSVCCGQVDNRAKVYERKPDRKTETGIGNEIDDWML